VSSIVSDVVVRAALESTLAIAEALLLNRLGLPFAGITVFSGLAAYGVAITLKFGPLATLPVAAIGLTIVLLFVVLAPRLPEDRCLLLSLAALAVARSFAGALPWLGGQLGISTTTTILPSQEAHRFVPLAVAVFLVAIGGGLILQRALLGLGVDIARLGPSEILAPALVPMARIRTMLFFFAAALGTSAGFLLSCYSGRVDPDIFRIDGAITILVVALAAGYAPLRLALVPLLFFAFPDLFSSLTGYQRAALAHVREIAWGLVILVLAGRGLGAVAQEKGSSLPVAAGNGARGGG